MAKWLSEVWLFDLGAWAYNIFTANESWQASCASLLDGVPSNPGRLQVLDLGTGPGVSALAMGRQRPEARFIGLDLSQPMLTLANQNRTLAGWPLERLSLLRGNALKLPFMDGEVDAVTGHSFLYLLPQRRATLQEVRRVLRAGGHVAFLEPHASPVNWTWLLRQASLRLWTSVSLWRLYSRLHRRFTAESLHFALHQAGLINITTEVTLGGFGIYGRAQKS